MIGIAVGNREGEVMAFREEYKVLFPVVPDPQWGVHRAIGRSRTPYSIFVRQDDVGGPGVVAGTHLGFDPDYESLHYALSVYMTVSIAAIRGPEPEKEVKKAVTVKPIMTEEELAERMKAALSSLGTDVKDFEKVDLDESRIIYTALVVQKGSVSRFFAEAVSRPSVCDVCHDVHFIYVFDGAGKVHGFIPLQLTKWENEPWDEADIAKMRGRILGRYISEPMTFNPEIDAVSSATMTSAIIFDSLAQGEELLRKLNER